MKNKPNKALLVLGGIILLGLGAAAGAATYHFVEKGKEDTSQTEDSGSDPEESTPDETVESETGNLSLVIEEGRVFRAPALGDTKSVVATISPENATNKKINWVCGDETKITLAAASTASGEAQTLTLVSKFDGAVPVTATSDDNPYATVTISVSCELLIDTLDVWGVALVNDAFDRADSTHNRQMLEANIDSAWFGSTYGISGSTDDIMLAPLAGDGDLGKQMITYQNTSAGDIHGRPYSTVFNLGDDAPEYLQSSRIGLRLPDSTWTIGDIRDQEIHAYIVLEATVSDYSGTIDTSGLSAGEGHSASRFDEDPYLLKDPFLIGQGSSVLVFIDPASGSTAGSFTYELQEASMTFSMGAYTAVSAVSTDSEEITYN